MHLLEELTVTLSSLSSVFLTPTLAPCSCTVAFGNPGLCSHVAMYCRRASVVSRLRWIIVTPLPPPRSPCYCFALCTVCSFCSVCLYLHPSHNPSSRLNSLFFLCSLSLPILPSVCLFLHVLQNSPSFVFFLIFHHHISSCCFLFSLSVEFSLLSFAPLRITRPPLFPIFFLSTRSLPFAPPSITSLFRRPVSFFPVVAALFFSSPPYFSPLPLLLPLPSFS